MSKGFGVKYGVQADRQDQVRNVYLVEQLRAMGYA